jgi:hypothetical protein
MQLLLTKALPGRTSLTAVITQACTKPPHLCIVTELMVGSLADLLYGKHRKQLPDAKWHDKRKLNTTKGIVNGLMFLHAKQVLPSRWLVPSGY